MEKDCKGHDIDLVEVESPELRFVYSKTRFFDRDKTILTWLRVTSCERISSISVHAITDWTVVIDPTFGILTASIWTWIDTFLINASFVVAALRANNTFRSTTRWTTNIVRQTRANCLVIDFPTLRVWTAWRWLTRVDVGGCNS